MFLPSQLSLQEVEYILDDYRSSLRPAMVEALVCASSFIRGSHQDNQPPIIVVSLVINLSVTFHTNIMSNLHDIRCFHVQDEEEDVEFIPFPKSEVESS